MKQPIFLYALLFLYVSGYGQDTGKDPYAIFGHQSDTRYETGLQELLYISNKDTTSPIKAMAFDVEKNEILLLGWNDSLIDIKDIKPEHFLKFISTDPLASKHPDSSPYNFTDNSPIARKDPDGRDWIVTTVIDQYNIRRVHLKFTGAILNSGNMKPEAVARFRDAAVRQIKDTYERHIKESENISQVPGVPLNVMTPAAPEAYVSIEVELRVINSKSEVKKTDHLIEIVPEADMPLMNKKPQWGYTTVMGGKYMKINERAVPGIIWDKDPKTVPHELGHTLGLWHPNSKNAPDGQRMKDGTHDDNLMYQTGYQNILLKQNSGNGLTVRQLNWMQNLYDGKSLNKENTIPKK